MASEVVCGLIFRVLLPVCLAAGKRSFDRVQSFASRRFCVNAQNPEPVEYCLNIDTKTCLYELIFNKA